MGTILTIDIGNTNTKFVIFSQQNDIKPEFIKVIKNNEISVDYLNKSFFEFINNNYYPSNIIISSVNKKIEEYIKIIINIFQKELNKKRKIKNNINIIHIKMMKNLPFAFKYNPLNSYGKDRLANLFFSLKSGTPFISIDIGTAITIDYINSKNIYSGGIIIPSAQLMLKSLNNFTDLLPEININKLETKKIKKVFDDINNNNNLGFSTKENMILGNFSTIIYSIVSYIANIYYKEVNNLSKNRKLNIVLTGNEIFKKLDSIIKNKIKVFNNINLNLLNIIYEDFLVNKGLKIFFDYYYN